MTANGLFNELQADIIGRQIVLPKVKEISGWGAAVAAGIGAQLISLDEFKARHGAVSFAKKNLRETQLHLI